MPPGTSGRPPAAVGAVGFEWDSPPPSNAAVGNLNSSPGTPFEAQPPSPLPGAGVLYASPR